LQWVAQVLREGRVTDLPAADDPDPQSDPTSAAITSEPADPADVVRNLHDPDHWSATPAGATAAPPQAATPKVSAAGDDDATLDTDLAAWTAPDANPPRIAILGRIDIDARGTAPERRKALHNEITVYLAAHPRGANQMQLIDAIWPNGVNENTARGFLAAVRRWLSTTPDGQAWLPDARDNHNLYRLQPGYLLDWQLFTRLRARARRPGGAGIADLRTALTLVRGRPLTGTDTHNHGRAQYTWLPQSGINPPHVLAAIIDTAHHLAQLYLDQGDTTGARWAVGQAWTADPDRIDDQPWLDLMHAEHIDGNRAELHQLADQLRQARDAEILEDLVRYQEINKLLRA
jgi:hypothetical protein